MTKHEGQLSAKHDGTPGGLCPEGRLSRSTKPNGDREVVHLENYIPYLLSSTNNALSSGASLHYLAHFGLGIVEWRVISMLAIEPHIMASRICEVVALDKAATSRALRRLHEKVFRRL